MAVNGIAFERREIYLDEAFAIGDVCHFVIELLICRLGNILRVDKTVYLALALDVVCPKGNLLGIFLRIEAKKLSPVHTENAAVITVADIIREGLGIDIVSIPGNGECLAAIV